MDSNHMVSAMDATAGVPPEVRKALLPAFGRGMAEARRLLTIENDLVPPLLMIQAGDGTWMTIRSGWTGNAASRDGFKLATQMIVCGLDAKALVCATTGWAAAFQPGDKRAQEFMLRRARGEALAVTDLPEDIRSEVFVQFAADRPGNGWFRICGVRRDEQRVFQRLDVRAEHGASTREQMFPAVESWMCELMPRPEAKFSAVDRLTALAELSRSVLEQRQPFAIVSWPPAGGSRHPGDEPLEAMHRLRALGVDLMMQATAEGAVEWTERPDDDDDQMVEEVARSLGLGKKNDDGLVN